METTSENLPSRKHLPHLAPVGVSQYTVGAPYFITICANRQHYGIIDPVVVPNTPNQPQLVGRVVLNAPPTPQPLLIDNTASCLIRALDHYHTKGVLFPRIALVMPDHFHFIASFSESVDMAQLIRNWKRWTARETGIIWQDGFFDHRLRNVAEAAEKLNYIAMNPVRKGLCETPDTWPFRKLWE